jgi:hypothetical protein
MNTKKLDAITDKILAHGPLKKNARKKAGKKKIEKKPKGKSSDSP